MSPIKFCIFSLLILLLLSCKKSNNDEVYNALPVDTIYPLPYFPVYPGSFWKYVNNHGDTVLFDTDNSFVKHSFVYGDAEKGVFQTAPNYVPKWNGFGIRTYYFTYYHLTYYRSNPEHHYIYGYYTNGEKFLSTNLGEEWVLSKWDDYYQDITRSVASVNGTISFRGNTYNDVIEIDDFSQRAGKVSARHYYAKNIGLIQKEDDTDTIQLVQYYINH